MDMHSGGSLKEACQYIYIEAPIEEAKVIFYNKFKHNPERISCTCCGEDYSISEEESIAEASAYDRNCEFVYKRPDGTECPEDEGWVWGKGLKEGYWSGYVERQDPRHMRIRKDCATDDSDPWGLYMTVEQYIESPSVLVIRADEISDKEREGEIPEQGYVWVG